MKSFVPAMTFPNKNYEEEKTVVDPSAPIEHTQFENDALKQKQQNHKWLNAKFCKRCAVELVRNQV